MAGKRADRTAPATDATQPPATEASEPAAILDMVDLGEAVEDVVGADGGEDEVGDVDDDDQSEDLDSFDDMEVFGSVQELGQQLTQVLVTEDGVPIVDVLQGIQDALDKQNKILYKLVSVIESK